VIIGDFYFVCVAFPPHKTDPPLIVDADAVLSLAIPSQRFEVVASGRCQVRQSRCHVQLKKLSQGNALDGLESPDTFPLKESFRLRVAERLDHGTSLYCHTFSVKRYMPCGFSGRAKSSD
jgi:hypothetical protein